MTTHEHPIERLRSLLGRGASGELVCASATLEVHVYVQRGRIAWATDSRNAFAFVAQLRELARIDQDTLRQVLEECRRERLPVGETLVAWGLATHEEVRAALAHQVSLALSQLARFAPSPSLFLERDYRAYDASLTFALGDVAAELGEPRGSAPSHRRGGLANSLRATTDAAWVEVLADGVVVDADPWCDERRAPPALAAALDDGADFAALRTARTSVIGLAAAEGRAIWAHLAPGSTFGRAVAALWSAVANGVIPEVRATVAGATAWSLGAEAATEVALVDFRRSAEEVVSVVVLGPDRHTLLAGCGSQAMPAERCIELARRRAPGLLDARITPAADEAALDALGVSPRTAVFGDAEVWCFGADLDGDSLWMCMERCNAQGLGWAYLASLIRTCERTRGRLS